MTRFERQILIHEGAWFMCNLQSPSRAVEIKHASGDTMAKEALRAPRDAWGLRLTAISTIVLLTASGAQSQLALAGPKATDLKPLKTMGSSSTSSGRFEDERHPERKPHANHPTHKGEVDWDDLPPDIRYRGQCSLGSENNPVSLDLNARKLLAELNAYKATWKKDVALASDMCVCMLPCVDERLLFERETLRRTNVAIPNEFVVGNMYRCKLHLEYRRQGANWAWEPIEKMCAGDGWKNVLDDLSAWGREKSGAQFPQTRRP